MSRPSPSEYVTPFACELLSEQGFGFRKANNVGCCVFASHFLSDEIQDDFGPPTDDEPFRYEFAAPLGT
jgi:hypothetical protein